MFFLRIIQYFLGNVRFSADGGFPEKFLNLAAQDGIGLWNIRRKGSGICASTLYRNYKKLHHAALHSGVTLEVMSRKGLPFFVKRYSKRKGLATGIVLFIVTLWFCSSFIWTVRVTGNSRVSAEEITQTLSELGVKPGAFPLLLNVKQVEQEALIKLPEISWLAINIHGSTANVQVRERKYQPEIVAANIPCNVKAAQTGQIIRLETYEGTPMVRNGDTIQKGQLLVSGVIDDKNSVVHFVHASAKAYAKTNRDLQVTVKYKQQVQAETGKSLTRKTLGLFNLDIPLYLGSPKGNYRVSLDTANLKVFGVSLPFSMTTRTYKELKPSNVTLTKDQAEKQGRGLLDGLAKTELSGAKILSQNTEVKAEQDQITVFGHYSCEEDISYQEAIQIS